MVTVAKLDGVPLFFARGVPERPQSFSIEAGFRDVGSGRSRACAPRTPASFGELEKITSAGVLVNKPGMHGLGRAFDHDAWTFEHVDIRPIATTTSPTRAGAGNALGPCGDHAQPLRLRAARPLQRGA